MKEVKKTSWGKNRSKNFYFIVYKLIKQGLSPVFKNYTQQFLRLMISLERKGRGEYVKINQKDNSDDLINKVGNLDNMLRSRK